MGAPSPARVVYSFGPFRVDAADRVLWRDGVELPLTLKAAEILLLLLENCGHVVEKDTLLTRVWPNTFVEESTLAQNIRTLRKTLGKQANSHKEYIGTVPRRGYRFDAPVSRNGQAVSSALPGAPLEERPIYGLRRRWVFLGMAGLAALVVAGLVALRFREKSASGTPQVHMRLAVLPFVNLSGDPSQEYLSEGLTEEMITQLGSLNPERLSVIARSSAMAYRNTSRSAQEIGRELEVDFLLEGSMRREGERIRVSTELVRASDQSNLWTANYDRELRDILTLERDVARSVASQIELQLTSQQISRLDEAYPPDAQAYELYLKARHFWNRRTPDTIAKAIELLQRAIARNPSYARAHAALADCYVIQSIYRRTTPVTESLRLAQAEANRALELDPALAEAHATLAYAYLYEWNFPAVEPEFQKSIRLNPRYATAHQWYAEYLRFVNRQEEAIAEINRALELDPLSPIINVEAALPYFYRGELDKAVAQLRRTIDLDPYFASAHGHLCEVYDAKGQYREALQECLAAKALGDANWIEEELGVIYVHLGRPEKARAILRIAPHAEIYLALGDKEAALKQLEKVVAEREPALVGLKVDPRLAPLRAEPRFQAMLRRVGFPN